MNWFKRQRAIEVTMRGADGDLMTVDGFPAEFRGVLEWVQREFDGNRADREALKAANKAAGERIRKQGDEIEGLTHRNRELEENAGLFQEDLEKTSRLYQGARREIDALKAEIDRLNDEVDDLNDEIDELEAGVAEGERQGDLVSAVAEIAFELYEENEALKAKFGGEPEKTCNCKDKRPRAK